jgi:hypothetical protein
MYENSNEKEEIIVNFLEKEELKKMFDYVYDEIYLSPKGASLNEGKDLKKIPIFFRAEEIYKKAEQVCGKNLLKKNEFFEKVCAEIEKRKFADVFSIVEGKDFGFSEGKKPVMLIDEKLYYIANSTIDGKGKEKIKNEVLNEMKKDIEKYEDYFDKDIDQFSAEINGYITTVLFYRTHTFKQKQIENFKELNYDLETIEKDYRKILVKECNPSFFVEKEIQNVVHECIIKGIGKESEEELNLYFKAFVKEDFKTKFEKNFQFKIPIEIVNYFEKNTKSKIKKNFLKEKTITPKKDNKIFISKIKNANIVKI